MIKSDDNPLSSILKVDSTERTFFFKAKSFEEKQSWIGSIGKIMVKSSKKNIYIEYIETPAYQDIDIDNITSPKNNLISLFTIEYIAIEIIKFCASMFLESIEQQRTQGHIQMNEQLMVN